MRKLPSKSFKHSLFSLLFIVCVNSHHAIASNHLTDHLKMVGQGEMSWLFIDLYQASLYSPSGKYNEKQYPQALHIVYQKNIDKQHLISATEKEWQKLGLNPQQAPYWLDALGQLWPDIKKGDELLFMVEEDGSGYFYHNQKLLGAINSEQFSHAFLSIWLSQNTSEPQLRQQLIGK
ncbi:hypothetical protein CW745_00375 [Psychromonas sp. psych-6C06]|uniref:chalcone isomerase family protein n=1 Tax=Psychromonas sp. psych-6C06 TaxID=2058089 RepID=UPI000C327844|nr:chalcone isomerase family protein [Psychromonas sp. psych-6C06]PKF63346.1 hypothetical protein CW745_00375 [Psychromonas sp. psych-6C06]